MPTPIYPQDQTPPDASSNNPRKKQDKNTQSPVEQPLGSFLGDEFSPGNAMSFKVYKNPFLPPLEHNSNNSFLNSGSDDVTTTTPCTVPENNLTKRQSKKRNSAERAREKALEANYTLDEESRWKRSDEARRKKDPKTSKFASMGRATHFTKLGQYYHYNEETELAESIPANLRIKHSKIHGTFVEQDGKIVPIKPTNGRGRRSVTNCAPRAAVVPKKKKKNQTSNDKPDSNKEVAERSEPVLQLHTQFATANFNSNFGDNAAITSFSSLDAFPGAENNSWRWEEGNQQQEEQPQGSFWDRYTNFFPDEEVPFWVGENFLSSSLEQYTDSFQEESNNSFSSPILHSVSTPCISSGNPSPALNVFSDTVGLSSNPQDQAPPGALPENNLTKEEIRKKKQAASRRRRYAEKKALAAKEKLIKQSVVANFDAHFVGGKNSLSSSLEQDTDPFQEESNNSFLNSILQSVPTPCISSGNPSPALDVFSDTVGLSSNPQNQTTPPEAFPENDSAKETLRKKKRSDHQKRVYAEKKRKKTETLSVAAKFNALFGEVIQQAALREGERNDDQPQVGQPQGSFLAGELLPDGEMSFKVYKNPFLSSLENQPINPALNRVVTPYVSAGNSSPLPQLGDDGANILFTPDVFLGTENNSCEKGNQPQIELPLGVLLGDDDGFLSDGGTSFGVGGNSFILSPERDIDPLQDKSNNSFLNPPLPSVTRHGIFSGSLSSVSQPLASRTNLELPNALSTLPTLTKKG